MVRSHQTCSVVQLAQVVVFVEVYALADIISFAKVVTGKHILCLNSFECLFQETKSLNGSDAFITK